MTAMTAGKMMSRRLFWACSLSKAQSIRSKMEGSSVETRLVVGTLVVLGDAMVVGGVSVCWRTSPMSVCAAHYRITIHGWRFQWPKDNEIMPDATWKTP